MISTRSDLNLPTVVVDAAGFGACEYEEGESTSSLLEHRG